jgi:hypothetical protein
MSADVIAGALPLPLPEAPKLPGLSSPPDSNGAMDLDDSDSELSDIEEDGARIPKATEMPVGLEAGAEAREKELDSGVGEEMKEQEQEPEVDNIGEVIPDHYDDEGRVPVFKPTPTQFKDFEVFVSFPAMWIVEEVRSNALAQMNKVNSYGMQTGIIKIIPPQEWLDNQPRLDDIVKTVRVREPIKQDIMGTAGMYRQMNILHQRSYNLPEWRQLCDQSEHQPPAKRGERRANQDRPRTSGRVKKEGTPAGDKATPSAKRKPGRPFKRQKVDKGNTEQGGDRLPTPTSPPAKPVDNAESVGLDAEPVKLEPIDDEEPQVRRMGGRQAKPTTTSSRRKYGRREAAGKIDEAAFENFDYKMDISDYTPERCAELERTYWKTLTYAAPLYGADMLGSLFDERTTTWNLGSLPNLLDVMGTKIPGVNTAYLYLGMWKATFAWHLEDVDLYSINYLHFGAPKQWYSISQRDARRFEAAMKTIWPTDAKACDQFLRHKTFLISPSTLLQNFGIKVNKITHFPGEFIVTYPYGYHSGFNMGYNCAEAVNFALPSWLEMGRIAKKCDCDLAQDSVWIDVAAIERKLRGEETDYEETDEEEEEDEEDDNGPTDLPTPPESSGDTKLKQPRRKRKRVASGKDVKDGAKRLRLRMKVNHEPCCLCPNDIKSQPLLPTEDGRKAHRICAEYTPETDIDDGMIYNVAAIGKDRLDLKCVFCHSKKGAKIQCSQRKCTRSYHATCAAAAGMFVERGEIPVFGEDGTEYKQDGIEFSCRFHRMKRDKKLDGEALDDDENITKAALAVQVNEVCQFQFVKREIFAGVVVENRTSEETFLVDVLPAGYVFNRDFSGDMVSLTCDSERFEVEYKYLLLPDPADYHLPKPSEKAIPMPKERKAKDALVTTKRHADDLPRKDDIFVEGATWAEFNAFNTPKNSAQVKVDFTKERQIMYYLGKTSTEARAQYTADWTKPFYDIKCNFLDTIPKPPPLPRNSYPASYPRPNGQPLNPPKPAPRPILPPSHTSQPSSKSDKPYVYKPKVEQYYKQAQVNRSQQAYPQQAAPQHQYPQQYNFIDPKWRPVDNRSQNPYTAQAQQAQPSIPAVRTYSNGYQAYYNGYPGANGSRSSNQYPSHIPQAPPQANPAKRSAPQNASQKAPAKSHTPRSSSAAQLDFNTVFAKYPYLQKENNKAPSTYRSPYREDKLGFCNGYEGDFKAHMAAQMAKNPSILFQTSMQATTRPSQPPAAEALRKTYAPILPPQKQKYSSPAASYYPNGAPAQKQSTMPQHQVTKAGVAAGGGAGWEKKEAAGLHPAIRQDYVGGKMFHNNYQPMQTPLQQQQPRRESPILPPGYSRPQPQLQPEQPQPQLQKPQTVQPSQPPQLPQQQQASIQQYNAQSAQQTLINRAPPPPSQLQQHSSPAAQYYSHARTQPPQQSAPAPSPFAPTTIPVSAPNANFSQTYTPPIRSFYSDTYHATGVPLMKGFAGAGAEGKEGNAKGVFAHQAYFANQTELAGQVLGEDGRDGEGAAAVGGKSGADVPDVETDSTGMMEALMRNLQRVARQS